jgi:hypothetical protein
MITNSSLQPKDSDFKSLAIGLFGVISTIVAFLLIVALASSIGYDLACQQNFGCSIPGYILGALLWFVLTPIALKRYLKASRPIFVVVCSTIGLLIAYAITTSQIDKYVTQDNLSWFVLAFAILNGVFFMVTNALGDHLHTRVKS